MRKIIAFTLIELLVVAAVLAILAAVAVPIYTQYTVRVKIVKDMDKIQKLIDDITQEYEVRGAYPEQFSAFGQSVIGILPNTWAIVDTDNEDNIVHSLRYFISDDGLGAGFNMSLNGLSGIPDYTDPTEFQTNPTNHQGFSYGVRDIDGTLVVVCGHRSASVVDNMVPFEYLPAVCDCENVLGDSLDGFIHGGTC